MRKNIETSPILLAGMHRSGTSMVAKILKKRDVELGRMIDSNNESLFFQRINIWMMSLISSSWDAPKSFSSIEPHILDNIQLQLHQLLRSRSNSLYFGWKSIIRKKSFMSMQSAWGWKDPRNTFTAEIWRNIFPDMKVVYLVRHPIDIADSLMRRQKQEAKKDIQAKKKYSNIIKALLKINHTNYNSSMLINSYEDCFKLIDLYYNQILNNKTKNSIVVKFEDILLNPNQKVREIMKFCNLNINEDFLNDIESAIIKSKALSYRNNNNLLKFKSEFSELIAKMGYNNQ